MPRRGGPLDDYMNPKCGSCSSSGNSNSGNGCDPENGYLLRSTMQRPAGGPVLVPRPVGVPGSSSSLSQNVGVHSGFGIGGATIAGLWVTCTETGVSLQSSCAGALTFYHTLTGTKHYSTPGGPGLNCDIVAAHTYGSDSQAGLVMSPSSPDVMLNVTQLS